MIKVDGLTKYYGQNRGIEDISFTAKKGEILGVLGPNGAGKSTLFRILTGFLPATSGECRIADLDVGWDSLEVRQLIGYLPENVPLYVDMRVHEYLDYRARLKQLPKSERPARLETALNRCGIADVSHRLIGQLSKGYRQRVGLAAALIHEPEILVLDEPTIGLDPNQIREIRELVKSFAGESTVLFASHVLSEVEMICDRVLILYQGRMIAVDSADNLRHTLPCGRPSLHLEVLGAESDLRRTLEKVPGVEKIEIQPLKEHLVITLENSDNRDRRADIFAAICAGKGVILEMRSLQVNLEEIFIQLTAQAGEEIQIDSPVEKSQI